MPIMIYRQLAYINITDIYFFRPQASNYKKKLRRRYQFRSTPYSKTVKKDKSENVLLTFLDDSDFSQKESEVTKCHLAHLSII
jgi:hypothetical protein